MSVNRFNNWTNGVPVIPLDTPGDFSEWDNGVPVVDQAEYAVVFQGEGYAYGDAVIGSIVSGDIAAEGTGVALGQFVPGPTTVTGTGFGYALPYAVISGGGKFVWGTYAWCKALGDAFLIGYARANCEGPGYSIGQSRLTQKSSLPVTARRRVGAANPRLRHLDYAAHPFAYRRVSPEQELVRHAGD